MLCDNLGVQKSRKKKARKTAFLDTLGVTAVDRLNIVAHDRFQEIIDEANRADSVIRLQQVILDPEGDLKPARTVIARSDVERKVAQMT
jgi:hypothetical protein